MRTRKQILIVDDEADQLQTIRRGLFLLGIDCLTACDCDEALSQLSPSAGERIDLLLTDLTMPGKSGAQLVERARELRPDLPVMVITGLALSSEVMAIRALGIPILRKPFTPEQLGRAIDALLPATQREESGEAT